MWYSWNPPGFWNSVKWTLFKEKMPLWQGKIVVSMQTSLTPLTPSETPYQLFRIICSPIIFKVFSALNERWFLWSFHLILLTHRPCKLHIEVQEWEMYNVTVRTDWDLASIMPGSNGGVDDGVRWIVIYSGLLLEMVFGRLWFWLLGPERNLFLF